MNNDRRKALDEAMSLLEEVKGKLEDAKSLIENAGEEEQSCYDNLTEGLQAAERGQRMEEVASTLSDIANELEIDIDDMITRIDECKN